MHEAFEWTGLFQISGRFRFEMRPTKLKKFVAQHRPMMDQRAVVEVDLQP